MTSASRQPEFALRLSAHEFALLALLGDGPSLVGSPAGALSGGAYDAALGSLTARGILSSPGSDGDRAVPAEFAALVEPFVRGQLGVRAEASSAGVAGSVSGLVGEQAAIEYRVTGDDLIAVRPTTLGELTDAVLDVCGLADATGDTADASSTEPFELTAEALTQLLESTADADADPTSKAGLPEGAADYVQAMLDARGAGMVALTRHAEDGGVATVSINWIDGGEHGLWTARPEGDLRIRVRRLTRDDLRAQIVGALAPND